MTTSLQRRVRTILLALPMAAAAGGMVVSFGALAGCAEKKPGTPFIDTATDFAGPAVEITDDSTFTITTPTGGWEVEVDQTVRDRFGIRTFATLVRPPADAMTTTALTPHEVRIPAPMGVPVALYLRVVDPDQGTVDAVPYRLAATTLPRP